MADGVIRHYLCFIVHTFPLTAEMSQAAPVYIQLGRSQCLLVFALQIAVEVKKSCMDLKKKKKEAVLFTVSVAQGWLQNCGRSFFTKVSAKENAEKKPVRLKCDFQIKKEGD